MSLHSWMNRRHVAPLVLILFILVNAGCGPVAQRTADEPTIVATPSEATAAEIYGLVIRQLVGPDDTFGGQLPKQTLYLIRATNDAPGDPVNDATAPIALPPAIQQAITTELADLPQTIIWVESATDVPVDTETGWVADEGVIIQLGNISFESPTRARVPGSIFIASLAAGGTTYVVEFQGDDWQLVGTTGVDWRS